MAIFRLRSLGDNGLKKLITATRYSAILRVIAGQQERRATEITVSEKGSDEKGTAIYGICG